MKYAGGCTLGPVGTATGPDCDFEERFEGDLGCDGYGNGVDSLGG